MSVLFLALGINALFIVGYAFGATAKEPRLLPLIIAAVVVSGWLFLVELWQAARDA